MAAQPDPPFRIFNEEQFRHLFSREVLRATRYQDFLSLCLARAECPEAPGLGQSLLGAVARRMAELLRSTDVIAIFEGVIAILLVHTSDSEAASIIQRLRERLEAETFQTVPSGSAVRPVLSLGLASFPTDATIDSRLLAHAQARLAAFEGEGGSSTIS